MSEAWWTFGYFMQGMAGTLIGCLLCLAIPTMIGLYQGRREGQTIRAEFRAMYGPDIR
mgnify:FL=1